MSDQTPVTGIKGSHAADAMKAALNEGLADIKTELEGLKSKVESHKDADLSPLKTEMEGLRSNLEDLAKKSAEVLKSNETQADLVEGFRARIDAIDTALQAPGAAGPQVPKTVGEQIFESEGFRAFIKDPKNIKKFSHELSNALFGPASIVALLGASGSKAAPVLGSAELGAMDYSARRQEVVSPALESVDAFMPLIPVVPTPGTELYDYRKETVASVTGFIRTTLAAAIDGDPTPTDTCTVADSSHLLVGTFLRFFDVDGNLLGRHAIVTNTVATGVLTFATDSLDFDAAIGDNVTAEQWGSTEESEAKPYSYLAAEAVQVVLKTIALNIATTRQRLNSSAGLDAWIRRVLPVRWRRNVAWQLLYGDATAAGAPQLAGFATESGVQTYSWSAGTVGDNRADAVLRAALLVVGENMSLVINKRDLLALRLMKTSTNDYIMSPNFGKIALEKMGMQWFLDGMPIIVSDAVVDGDFFLIDFAEASEMPDQGTSSLEFGLINDQFIRNEITVRYEATIAHAILDVTRYVYGTWDNTPVA
jgi:hypothetical protein